GVVPADIDDGPGARRPHRGAVRGDHVDAVVVVVARPVRRLPREPGATEVLGDVAGHRPAEGPVVLRRDAAALHLLADQRGDLALQLLLRGAGLGDRALRGRLAGGQTSVIALLLGELRGDPLLELLEGCLRVLQRGQALVEGAPRGGRLLWDGGRAL